MNAEGSKPKRALFAKRYAAILYDAAADRVICPVCGGGYKHLLSHARMAHGYKDGAEFRAAHGLPPSVALQNRETFEKQRRHGLEIVDRYGLRALQENLTKHRANLGLPGIHEMHPLSRQAAIQGLQETHRRRWANPETREQIRSVLMENVRNEAFRERAGAQRRAEWADPDKRAHRRAAMSVAHRDRLREHPEEKERLKAWVATASREWQRVSAERSTTTCKTCGKSFRKAKAAYRYCSRQCAQRDPEHRAKLAPQQRAAIQRRMVEHPEAFRQQILKGVAKSIEVRRLKSQVGAGVLP